MLTISDFDPKEVNKLAEIGTKLTEAEEKGDLNALTKLNFQLMMQSMITTQMVADSRCY